MAGRSPIKASILTNMRALRQLKLLLWKNYTLQKRRPIATLFQLGLPILFILILLLIRVLRVKEEDHGATVWHGFRPLTIPYQPPNGAKWQLGFAPVNAKTNKIMMDVSKLLNVKLVPFGSEKDMVTTILNDEEKGATSWKFIGGVVFQNDVDKKDVSYKIRLASSLRNGRQAKKRLAFGNAGENWHTKTVFPLTFGGLGPRSNTSASGGPPDYYREGFLGIQHAVDIALTVYQSDDLTTEKLLKKFNVKMQRFPYPKYIKDPFVIAIQISLPLLIMLSLVYTALLTVKGIVYEKERKLKESMKIMGLSGYLHWLAWFVKCFLFLLIPMAIITIMLTVEFGSNGKMLNKSDPSLIFVFLVLYAISSIMYCFMISTLFYRANIAAAGGGISWFASYVPYFFISMYYDLFNTPQKTASCLDFNVAMAFGAYLIGNFEGQGTGVRWSNLFQGVTVDDGFTFGAVLMMLLIDCFVYGIIMWYIEAVKPGEFGIPQPWYFPFKKSYWCGTPQKTEIPDSELGDFPEKGFETEFLEKEPEGLYPGIQIINLKKTFNTGSGEKVAVDGVYLNMYEGQITALLGHNGAGKTTTISMLTGLFPPTSGNAVVNGYDILNNIAGVRESLGICPQHNVLFDTLTVEEHLWFFAKLKGISDPKGLKDAVDHMITSIGLEDKRHVATTKLSGGMKRKLSVGIALIGDSKIVILDEPTSGMDPAARRSTWDLLQKERAGRTILLTTHFMDEADLLGDRIAIMAKGAVKCCGSSLFLKNRYGVGYHMVMVKDENCKVSSITKLIKKYVPSAKLENDVGLELSYVLPSEYAKKFEGLFTELEDNKTTLGISSYGASVTTLEEVFLKVKEEETANVEPGSLSKKLYRQLSTKSSESRHHSSDSSDQNGSTPHDPPSSPVPMQLGQSNGSIPGTSGRRNAGSKLFMQRWRAMFFKRLLHSRRYKASIVSQLIMPGIWTILAMVAAKIIPKPTDSPARTLSTAMFQDNYVPFSQHGWSTEEKNLANIYARQFSGTLTSVRNVTSNYQGNLTSYILKTSTVDIGKFNTKCLIGLGLEAESRVSGSSAVTATAWFNNAAYHSLAVTMNALDNAMFRYFTNTTGSITTVNHPLPRTTSQSVNDLNRSGVGFNVSFNLLFGMAFLASSFVIFLVQERSSKAKHLQFVSGVSPFCYWTATFAWDAINYSITVVLVVIIFAAFQIPAYTGDRFGYVVLLLFLYGWAVLPLIYLFSFLFKVASTAFIRLTIFNVITGLATLLTVFILGFPSLDLLDVRDGLKWAFLFLPNYSLGQAFVDIYTNHQALDIYDQVVKQCVDMLKKFHVPSPEKQCENIITMMLKNSTQTLVYQKNYLAWENPGIGRYLVFMAWEGLVFFALVLMIENGVFSRLKYHIKGYFKGKGQDVPNDQFQSPHESPVPMDDDVVAEIQRIDASYGEYTDVLVLDDVTKYYGYTGKRFRAVNRISLGIPHGECFGLLGLNGAGKTSTFKMITGDESITEGSISVDGYDVSTQMNKVRQYIGYCPQFDALIDLMTGRELLTMYARLRGIPEKEIPTIVEDLAVSLTFDEHIDKVSKSYSGGNKRKLSTAMALVGDPAIIFLDEPTTGMDPAARRMLWDALTRYRQGEKSIVITSHSMEECEALCTRLAVMVNGQFKCLGSPQHLKSKFGEGYTLLARIGRSNPDTTALKQFIHSNFPGSLLKDEHQGFVHYQLKDDNKSWAKVFGVMEKAKQQYDIDDYSVSQTTLEQVFLNFARHQIEDERTLQMQ